MDGILTFLLAESTVFAVGLGAAIVMFLLAAIHCFWAMGGTWGLRAVVPTVDERPVIQVTALGVFVIFFMLLLSGLLILGRIGIFGANPQPAFLYDLAPWALAILFGMRALGDFHYTGLFKKQKYTYFAWWDTWVYVPLCIVLSASMFLVAWAG